MELLWGSSYSVIKIYCKKLYMRKYHIYIFAEFNIMIVKTKLNCCPKYTIFEN